MTQYAGAALADEGARTKRIEDTREAVNRLQGELKGLEDRDAEIVSTVAEAKGRIEHKDNVEQALTALQAEAHERAVGRYERMLTAIVGDVIDRNMRVRLHLYTERGLPALKVFVDRGDGYEEDVMRSKGGSVANVISLGLRMIALAQAGLRLFLVLDEPDYWISPSNIPAYARVLNQMAKYVGVQVLFITHHDTQCFDDESSVARLMPDGTGSVAAEPDPRQHAWAEDESGLRYVRLQNFTSHADTVIPLNPGVNVVVGPNDVGKSGLTQAFRAVAYGDCQDTDIRHGQDHLTVELGIEHGRAIRFSRKPKRNPRMQWELVEADGSVSQRAGGRVPPEWVTELLGIEQKQDLDIQIAHQKTPPVFVLTETPSKRAQILSIGRESDVIRQMIARHREWVQQDRQTIRKGEADLGPLRERKQALQAAIEQAEKAIQTAGVRHSEVSERQGALSTIDAAVTRLKAAQTNRGSAETQLAALSGLPAEPPELWSFDALLTAGQALRAAQKAQEAAQARIDALKPLPETAPSLHDTETLERIIARLGDAANRRGAAEAQVNGLQKLPDQTPTLHDVADLQRCIRRVADAQDVRTKAENDLVATKRELDQVHADLDALIESLGGSCPTCGQTITRTNVLDHAEAAEVSHEAA